MSIQELGLIKDTRRRNSFAFYMSALIKKQKLKEEEEAQEDYDPVMAKHRTGIARLFDDFKVCILISHQSYLNQHCRFRLVPKR